MPDTDMSATSYYHAQERYAELIYLLDDNYNLGAPALRARIDNMFEAIKAMEQSNVCAKHIADEVEALLMILDELLEENRGYS